MPVSGLAITGGCLQRAAVRWHALLCVQSLLPDLLRCIARNGRTGRGVGGGMVGVQRCIRPSMVANIGSERAELTQYCSIVAIEALYSGARTAQRAGSCHVARQWMRS
jgi:hypothetical protein